MKKIFSILLLLAFLFTSTVFVFAEEAVVATTSNEIVQSSTAPKPPSPEFMD